MRNKVKMKTTHIIMARKAIMDNKHTIMPTSHKNRNNMSSLNTKPIHIQVRDVNHKLIENATIKVIQRKDKILYNEKSPSGEIILDDIESLKDCHAFRVEIEHPHYKSRPKTDAPCIRLANLHKPHTLEFHYQDKLLVSNVSAEIRDTKINNTTNTTKELESHIPITIHLKAYYNQDTIPNKDKQSKTQQQIYQNQKTQTKWGYILFDKDKDIDILH